MYCVKCGSLVHENLNFCNSCGAKLKEEGGQEKPINPLSYLITALCIIGGGGLLLLVAMIGILLEQHANDQTVILVAALFLASWLFINSMILRQISRLIGTHIESKSSAGEKQPASLYSHNTAQLDAPPRQPGSSVTDHTTRTLDEVLIKER